MLEGEVEKGLQNPNLKRELRGMEGPRNERFPLTLPERRRTWGPEDESSEDGRTEDLTSRVVYAFSRSSRRIPADHCPVEHHPTILMMGAEGSGLRASLLNLAHYKVGIRHGRDVDEIGVDSLNVSVAASLLCYEALRKPVQRRRTGQLLF